MNCSSISTKQTGLDLISVTAPAKLNLNLRIIGRLHETHRHGGFHLIQTVIAPLDLCDELSIQNSHSTDIEFSCYFSSSLEEHIQLSFTQIDREKLVQELNSPKNLAYRAAQAILQEARLPKKTGISIALTKSIPIGAGLGGASADAAAVLIALNKLFQLNYSEAKLCELGASLGSDVPACVTQRLIFADGTGTRLADLKLASHPQWTRWFPSLGLIVVQPSIAIDTSIAYQSLPSSTKVFQDIPKPGEETSKDFLLQCCNCNDFSDILTILNQDATSGGLEKGSLTSRDTEESGCFKYFTSCLGNDFEETIFSRYEEVKRARDILLHCEARHTLLAGSGSAVVGLTENIREAQNVEEQVRINVPKGWFVQATKFR